MGGYNVDYSTLQLGSPDAGGGGGTLADTGSNSALSGLNDLFSGIGSAFSDAYRAVNPVVSVPRGQPSVIYNPATGQYVTPGSVTAQSTISPLILLLLGAVVVYLIVR